MSKSLAEDIISKWNDWEKTSSERSRRNENIERLYRADASQSGLVVGGIRIASEGKSDEEGSQGSEMFRSIEVDTAKIHEIIHPDPIRFFATEIIDEKKDTDKRAGISDRMAYRLRNDNFPSKSISMVRSACLFGNMCGAVMKHPSKNTATIRIINWRDLAYDMLAPGLAESRWVIERSFIDEDTLESRSEGESAIYDSGPVSKILKARNKKKDDAGPEPSAQENDDDPSVQAAGLKGNPSGKDIEILDYWLVSDDGKAKVSTVSVSEKVALRSEDDSPFDFPGHNYFGAPLINLFGRSEGIGFGEAIASTQNTINRNRKAMIHLIDHALLNIWGKLKGSGIKYKSIRKIRDKIIEMKEKDGLFSIIPDISPIQVAISFEQLLKDELRQKSAAVDSRQGPTNEPTLGQAVIARDESSSRHMIYAQNLAPAYERMLSLFWKVLNQFDTEPSNVPGAMPGVFTDLVPSTVEQDVSFSVDITSPRRNPQARMEFLMKVVELSLRPEMVDEEGKPIISRREAMSRLMKGSGEPDAESLLTGQPIETTGANLSLNKLLSQEIPPSPAKVPVNVGASGNGLV